MLQNSSKGCSLLTHLQAWKSLSQTRARRDCNCCASETIESLLGFPSKPKRVALSRRVRINAVMGLAGRTEAPANKFSSVVLSCICRGSGRNGPCNGWTWQIRRHEAPCIFSSCLTFPLERSSVELSRNKQDHNLYCALQGVSEQYMILHQLFLECSVPSSVLGAHLFPQDFSQADSFTGLLGGYEQADLAVVTLRGFSGRGFLYAKPDNGTPSLHCNPQRPGQAFLVS